MRDAWRGVVVLLLAGLFVAGGLRTPALAAPTTDAADEALSLTDPRTGRHVPVEQVEQLEQADGLLHLAFFATWCHECLDEFDQLADYEDRWADRGYRLILVAVQERQTVERLERFIESRLPPGRLLFDSTGAFIERLKVGRVPTHLLLDADAQEVGRFNEAAAVGPALEQQLGQPR